MPIRGWWASRRQQKLDAFDKNHGYATAEEQQQLKRRSLFRRGLDARATGGMPDGTGISPTGTPMDFTADQERPRYQAEPTRSDLRAITALAHRFRRHNAHWPGRADCHP